MNELDDDYDYDGEMHTGHVYPSGATAIYVVITAIIIIISGGCWILQILTQH